MARKTKQPGNWIARFPKTAIREAFEDAMVDAYGEHEQYTALLTIIEDRLAFPFKARVLGEKVAVVGMAWPDDDAFGLDLICEHRGKRYAIDARSVQPLQPWPDGLAALAAYLDWKQHL